MVKKHKTIIIILILGIMNILYNYGTPMGRSNAEKIAIEYAEEKYNHKDLKVESLDKWSWNNYDVNLQSETQEDINFFIYVKGQKVMYDDYDYCVINKGNVLDRIEKEYYDLAKIKYDPLAFMAQKSFNRLEFMKRQNQAVLENKDGEILELELNKKYDVKNLAEKYGKLTCCRYTELSEEKIEEIVLYYKDKFDKEGIKFNTISVTLIKRNTNKTADDQYNSYELLDFPYDEINGDISQKIKTKINKI